MPKLNYWNGSAWVTIAEDNSNYNTFRASGGRIGEGGQIFADVYGVGLGKWGEPNSRVQVINSSTENLFGPVVGEAVTLGDAEHRWKSLYTTGGRIYHTTTVGGTGGSYVIEPLAGAMLLLNVTSASGITNQLKVFVGDDGVRYVNPGSNLLTNLGNSSIRYRDIWVGASSTNTNGYTKLQNGLMLQWGTQTQTGIGMKVIEYVATYPTAFPTNCIRVIPFVGGTTESGSPGQVDVRLQTVGQTNFNYQVMPNEYTKSFVLHYLAIGY